MLLQQANKFSLKIHPNNTTPISASWIDRFKMRYDIVRVHKAGESGGVDTEVVRHWKEDKLNGILQKYSPSEIYNADEKGLFLETSSKQISWFCKKDLPWDNSQKLELLYWMGQINWVNLSLARARDHVPSKMSLHRWNTQRTKKHG